MKKLLLLIPTLIFVITINAQTYTSVSDGNWTDPSNWSPAGVPTPGTIVIIDHDIILDTDYGYSSGSITINSGASLVQNAAGRNFAVSGGTLDNAGSIEIDNIGTYSGNINNSGIMSAILFYNSAIFENYGIINQTDSIQNDGTLNNYVGSTIDVLRLLNNNSFLNEGNFLAFELYNDGYLDNQGTIDLTRLTNADTTMQTGYLYFDDMTNSGYFYNNGECYGTNDITNMGYFHHLNVFTLDQDFFNSDSVNGEAYFFIESLVSIGNDFYNTDTIDGTSNGQFCITNSTGNEGVMTGNFDFCDLTPPATAPFIDYNIGSIGNNITYCSTPCNTFVISNEKSNFKLYPNPVKDIINIDIPEKFNIKKITISNSLGEQILSTNKQTETFSFDLSNYSSAVYFINIVTNTNTHKFKVIKE